ncbi:MAG: AzlD domain-containing protein [Clostridia bacterium]|nr:AzlD domain-containing protein [Clostridia bacterium]
MKEFFIYLAILVGSTYLVRALPFALMRKKITNRFIRSFLYYIPYTVLAAMTFPGAIFATGNIVAASAGLAAGGILALQGKGLTLVAFVSCLVSLILDLVMIYAI